MNLLVCLAKAEEGYLGAVLPTGLSIPEFDGFDHAAIAGKVDGACLAAGRNAIADEKFFVRSVVEVNDNFLEENFAALDPQLDGAETAIVPADVNVVVILGSVNVSVAEVVPTALRLSAHGGECESEQKCNGS